MSFEEKRVQSLALLAQTGIRPTVYAPPVVLLLWKLGVKVLPPDFMGFASVTALSALWYTPMWGLLMWAALWLRRGVPIGSVVIVSCAGGLLFGLGLALYYLRDRKKYDLPDWDSIGAAA
jgi:hypothetical protein